KLLFMFALPAVFAILVAELYSMVDTFFVGRYVGPEAIGALTIAFPIQRLMFSIAMMIAIGTSTRVARSSGEKNIKGVKKSVGTSINLTILLIGILSVFIYIFRLPLLKMLGSTDTLLIMAEDYTKIIIFGSIFQGLMYVLSYIMTAFGYNKVTLKATAIGAISNLIIDIFLVAILGYGVKGAAYATTFSQIFAFLYSFYKFKKFNFHKYYTFTLNKIVSRSILTIGFATFIVEVSDAIVAIFLNNKLSAIGGDIEIITVGIITKISMFLFIVIIGMSNAMQTIASYNYGAKKYTRVKETLKKSLYTLSSITTLMWLLMMIYAEPIVKIFLEDKELLDYVTRSFRTVIIIFPLLSIYYISIYYYQVIERPRESLILSIYRQIVIFIPLAWILINTYGSIGAWIAFPLSDLISFLTGVYYLKKAKVIEDKRYIKASHLA
ncbi:MAG: MATE family efflux transporter, partial [Clostridium sp.]|nr:MATE family efflux transporter [Clostridium sp.]